MDLRLGGALSGVNSVAQGNLSAWEAGPRQRWVSWHFGQPLSGPNHGTPLVNLGGPGVELIAGGVLRIQQRPHSQTNFGGIDQNWHWERDCWSLHGFVSDDTSYRLPPQPRESVRAVAEAAEQLGLFDQCTSSP